MVKWIACGSVTNPKTSREYLRFSSRLNYATQKEAESEAQRWREEKRYEFIWVEKVGA